MPLRGLFHRFGAGRRARQRWQDGLSDETRFWADWLRTRGLEWPDDFAARMDPQLPLQTHIAEHLPDSDGPALLLDVGAGPLTVLGKTLPDRELRITAVDPLAETYDRLLAEHAVTPLVRTEPVEAETLTRHLPADHFDLAYARNCLDHAYDPVESIVQMLRVTRPGGRVFLEHAENEGEHERYQGLHQWNFRIEADRLVVWRPEGARNVSDLVSSLATGVAGCTDGWVRAVFTRREDA